MMKTFTFYFAVLALLPFFVSCAVLSDGQQKNIKKLAVLGSDAAKAPSVMVVKLSEVRLDRGLFYSSTLSSSDVHIAELKALSSAKSEDLKIAKKFDAGIGFLNSYLYALRSLASDGRWEDYGVELRSIGRSLNSSLEKINDLEWFDVELPSDVVKIVSYSAASLSESFMKRRQMLFLRDFIVRGDTLVGVCVDSMVAVLKSEGFRELVENERAGLDNNYKLFLDMLPDGNVSFYYDREFVSNLQKIDDVESLRRGCITSLNAFKRAHSRVASEVLKRKDGDDIYQELIDLAEQIDSLVDAFSKD